MISCCLADAAKAGENPGDFLEAQRRAATTSTSALRSTSRLRRHQLLSATKIFRSEVNVRVVRTLVAEYCGISFGRGHIFSRRVRETYVISRIQDLRPVPRWSAAPQRQRARRNSQAAP